MSKSPKPLLMPALHLLPPAIVGCVPLKEIAASVWFFLVMKFTTPAMASEPYSADAPSVSTSTRSIASSGRLSRFTEPSPPEAPKPPKGATRRPLSSTSVYFWSRPWMAAVVVPLPLPLPLTELEDCWKLPPVIAGSFWISSVIDSAPVLSMASREMTVTGNAPSDSTRRIAEPVISTRWTSGLSWAQAFAAVASSRAVQICVRLNMVEVLPRGVACFLLHASGLHVTIY